MSETQENYNISNPHPSETYKYTRRDMLDCWIAARENLVRWGVGPGDKPDFSSWIREYYEKRQLSDFTEKADVYAKQLPPADKLNLKEELNKLVKEDPNSPYYGEFLPS